MQTLKRIINSKGEAEFVPISRREWADAVDSFSINNSQGDVSSSSLGYKYAIDTITYIVPEVTKQKYYTVTPSDFIPVEVGQGGLSDTMVTNLEFSSGGSFFDGLIPVGTSDIRLASVEAGIAPKSIAVNQWAKALGYNTVQIQQALYNNNWNVIEAQVRALKTNYDLGMQQVAFLGDPSNATRTPGLLTNADINTDTSTINKHISTMTAAEFQTFVGVIMATYLNNCAYTAQPDLFIMPYADYVGMETATSADFPIGGKLDYLLNAFRKITGNAGFQIKPLAYADAARNPSGLDTYMLTRMDRTTIRMDVQVPFMVYAPNTANNFSFQQVALSRFTGVGVYRPLEVLKYVID